MAALDARRRADERRRGRRAGHAAGQQGRDRAPRRSRVSRPHRVAGRARRPRALRPRLPDGVPRRRPAGGAALDARAAARRARRASPTDGIVDALRCLASPRRRPHRRRRAQSARRRAGAAGQRGRGDRAPGGRAARAEGIDAPRPGAPRLALRARARAASSTGCSRSTTIRG